MRKQRVNDAEFLAQRHKGGEGWCYVSFTPESISLNRSLCRLRASRQLSLSNWHHHASGWPAGFLWLLYVGQHVKKESMKKQGLEKES